MKTKLLKKLRKECQFKYKNKRWHILIGKYHLLENYTMHTDSIILKSLSEMNDRDHPLFDCWDWNDIYCKYLQKLETRRFKKL